MQQSQLVRGVLDLAVVAAVDAGASYGYELLRHLQEARFPRVSDASVYGTLKRLEEWGVLDSRLVESNAGPARRTYAVTRAGRRWLQEAEGEWRVLTEATQRLLNGSRSTGSR